VRFVGWRCKKFERLKRKLIVVLTGNESNKGLLFLFEDCTIAGSEKKDVIGQAIVKLSAMVTFNYKPFQGF
jgi:hypothetical protein